ncbi:DEAD/DEAH box helicase [Butyrivibrio sp. VCD2006]|uniref:DEAD/DEAH box helicase n=1 Tax=Butyrivibrio sp. VCD2006 TaxID=1280664 RepID=UPI000423025C|nr:AAA domain-containing protein [Butyrivibrio sp. VCD2006]
MNPVLIAAGIYLSARIVSFIAGELTESELNKQKEIDDEMDKIRSHYKESEAASTNEAIKNNEIIIGKKRELCFYLRSQAEARKAEFTILHEEIKESKRNVISALRAKDVVQTPLRRSSLELLLRQLSEAQEKCYSYIQYLDVYSDEVCHEIYSSGEPEVFCMQLPSNYPYIGKLLWIDIEQVTGNSVKYDIPNLFTLSVRITDIGLYELVEKSLVPIMITAGHRKEYSASLEKGAFKAYELANTHLGLSATVKEIQRQYIILTYQNRLELQLPKENLINPNRFPPIRATLTVYPVKWEYNLDYFSYGNGRTGYPVIVSERKEDAASSFSFRSFPLCFSEEDLPVFMDYYEKNNLLSYDEEFLIGPVDSNDAVLKKGSLLKLQFGDIPLFYLEVDEYEDRSDILRYYFRFHGLCKSGEKTFSADDIFLPFDVGFTPYFAGTSIEMIQHYMDIDDIDDVAALIWDLFEEFRIQNQIRKDREGMGYFFKWENITNQLISVLEQGDSIQVDVKRVDTEKRNMVFVDVINTKELEKFIHQFTQKADSLLKREWRPQFFVKDDGDNRYDTTVIDSGRRLRIVGKNVADIFSEDLNSIELYASNRPYAEYQQKAALRQFRIGQVINPMIQAACLNSASIISNFDNSQELVPFHNKQLVGNLSQKKSVEQAFKEKNIFLIQGPPGTGKTTVIRELVEQIFDTNDSARILIVSQANVAVDNALSELIKKYDEQTVRCGNGNKISEKFQRLRLQKRCQEYLEDLEQREKEFDKGFFEDWKSTIVTSESNDYSPALCELIIRKHRLIGATCVGLARRNIGLERTEFDLVVIDEAGKALPAELLIPLVRAKKTVIIGDQKQLPPVINPILYDEEKIDLEERAISENDLFCHSFFERLYNNAPASNKVMLDTQYRMPAVIGTAISTLFYEGKLKNGIGTEEKKPVLFEGNLTFINFDDVEKYTEKKNKTNKQITNSVEAQAAVSLVISVRKKNPSCKIAVITPYKGQKRLISNTFVKAGIHYQIDDIYVDTVDSFQGSEADVVVFCTTRAVQPTLFFKDTKRLNVALSRAKRELIILGRMKYFYRYSKNESCLPAMADYIKKNGTVIKADKCDLIHNSISKPKTKELFLSVDDISLPTAYYTGEMDEKAIQDKIDEYYKNGDFIKPLIVKRTSRGFILEENFEQFRAALDLDIVECLCRVVS